MEIAAANPKAGTKDLVTLILGEFKDNGLWTFSTDKDGNVTISRTKISQSQYDKATENMKSLDTNGFTSDERKQVNEDRKKSANWRP